MARCLTLGWGLSLLILALFPVFRRADDDAFPFSTYPMFAHRRDRPLLHIAEGVTDGRETISLPPELVANGPVMQALSTLARAASQGSVALKPLCQRIASNVAASPRFARVRRVQLVAARFDPIRYFEVGPEPEERRVLQRCRVRGGS
jgi:hypothetical protein